MIRSLNNMTVFSNIHSLLRTRSLRQTLFVYGGSLVNGGSLFLLNILLARALEKPVFGMFSLSVFVLSSIAELSDFGLNTGLLRFAPYYLASGEQDKLAQLVKTIWRWRVSLTIVLTAGGVVLASPIARYLLGQPEITPYLMYASVGIGGVIMLGFLTTFLQAQQRFFYQASIQSLKGVLRLALAVALYVLGVRNLFAYLTVYIVVPWLLFLVNYHVFPRGFRSQVIDPEVKTKLHAQLARFSFWLTVSSLAAIMAGKADQVIISHYLGLEEVAIYTIAWQLIQFFPLIYNSVTSVMMPKASSLHTVADLRSYVFQAFRSLSVGVILLALLIYPSQYIIHVLFSGSYDAAMPIYLILAYGMLLNIVSVPFSLVMNVYNRTSLTAASSLIQLVLTIVLTLIFIRWYGIMGVAYTFAFSMVTQVAWNVGWALYLLKKQEFRVE